MVCRAKPFNVSPGVVKLVKLFSEKAQHLTCFLANITRQGTNLIVLHV